MTQQPVASTCGAGRVTAKPTTPRKWKVWLVTVCGVYLVLNLVFWAMSPLLAGLAMPARLAVVVPIAVAAMVWVITPTATRRLGSWLLR
jgi:antibiotic biosynthesis monooxygenase (ABM) superfamily enzyme